MHPSDQREVVGGELTIRSAAAGAIELPRAIGEDDLLLGSRGEVVGVDLEEGRDRPNAAATGGLAAQANITQRQANFIMRVETRSAAIGSFRSM